MEVRPTVLEPGALASHRWLAVVGFINIGSFLTYAIPVNLIALLTALGVVRVPVEG